MHASNILLLKWSVIGEMALHPVRRGYEDASPQCRGFQYLQHNRDFTSVILIAKLCREGVVR
jgi:hypothetical protein